MPAQFVLENILIGRQYSAYDAFRPVATKPTPVKSGGGGWPTIAAAPLPCLPSGKDTKCPQQLIDAFVKETRRVTPTGFKVTISEKMYQLIRNYWFARCRKDYFSNVEINEWSDKTLRAAIEIVHSNEQLQFEAEKRRLDIFGLLRDNTDGSRVFNLDGGDENGLCPLIAKFYSLLEKRYPAGNQRCMHATRTIILNSVKEMHGSLSGITCFAVRAFFNALNQHEGRCPISSDGVDLEILEFVERNKKARIDPGEQEREADNAVVNVNLVELSDDDHTDSQEGKEIIVLLDDDSDQEDLRVIARSDDKDDENYIEDAVGVNVVRKDLFADERFFVFSAALAEQHGHYGSPDHIYAQGKFVPSECPFGRLPPGCGPRDVSVGGRTYLQCEECNGHGGISREDGIITYFEPKFFRDMMNPYWFPATFGSSFLQLLHHQHHNESIYPVLSSPAFDATIQPCDLPPTAVFLVTILYFGKHYVAAAIHPTRKEVVTVDGFGGVPEQRPKVVEDKDDYDFTAQLTRIMKRYRLVSWDVSDGTFGVYKHLRTKLYRQKDEYNCMPIACAVVMEWYQNGYSTFIDREPLTNVEPLRPAVMEQYKDMTDRCSHDLFFAERKITRLPNSLQLAIHPKDQPKIPETIVI